MELTLIVAATLTNGIGVKGGLPWRLPSEMAYFARVTSKAPEGAINALVMGRKSWESIPRKFRPLRDRFNVVVSTQAAEYDLGTPATEAVIARPSLSAALATLRDRIPNDLQRHRAFVIGGASMYTEALRLPLGDSLGFVNRILLTRIISPEHPDCDVFFPDFQSMDQSWKQASHQELQEWAGVEVPHGVQEERGTTYEYQMWIR